MVRHLPVVAALVALAAPLALAAGPLPFDARFAGPFQLGAIGNTYGVGNVWLDIAYSLTGGGLPWATSYAYGDETVAASLASPLCLDVLDSYLAWSTDPPPGIPQSSFSVDNLGSFCLDATSSPGHVLVHGAGTTRLVGGWGDVYGATGSGTWTFEGTVEGPASPGVAVWYSAYALAGTGALAMHGTYTLPG